LVAKAIEVRGKLGKEGEGKRFSEAERGKISRERVTRPDGRQPTCTGRDKEKKKKKWRRFSKEERGKRYRLLASQSTASNSASEET